MLSATVRHGKSAYSWNTTPRSGPGAVTGRSSMSTAPVVGGMNPATMESHVLLPHPLGPTMLTNSLSPTVKLRPLIASTASPLIVGKVLPRPRISIRAMSPRQIRGVDVRRHLQVLVEEPELVEAREGVLEVLGGDARVHAAEHVLSREVELGEDGARRLELGGHEVEDGVSVLGLVEVAREGDVVLEEGPDRVR